MASSIMNDFNEINDYPVLRHKIHDSMGTAPIRANKHNH